MIDVSEFKEFLENELDINFYTGVPDSQLSSFCDYIENEYGIGNKHIIAPNEGNAVALASGYHLSTGKIPLVYMQNSGLGNIVNPVTSLTHELVYSIPMIYLIGWRGEPGVKDEPQHAKQGKITLDLLKLLDIDYMVLTKDTTLDDIKINIKNKPFAFVVSKGAFKDFKIKKSNENKLSREEAIKTIVNHLTDEDIIVSTTGKTSRELFEYREELDQGHNNDFLTVGSMGHSSSIALAIALNKPQTNVFCFDGDGAILMHMGALALIGSNKPNNFYHILFNNQAHESVGGLPTIMGDIEINKIAESCGYKNVFKASNKEELTQILPDFLKEEGPVFLIVDVAIKSRKDLGRPTTTPIENKINLMKKLNK